MVTARTASKEVRTVPWRTFAILSLRAGMKTLSSQGAIPYWKLGLSAVPSSLSRLWIRMKQKDEFRPSPTAHATGWYVKTYFRFMELQKENCPDNHLGNFWTGSQLLLRNHSALGQLRRALGLQTFNWMEAIRIGAPANHCYELK